MVLKWNVVEFGQFPLITHTDAEHIYVSVCGSVATKLVLSCLLLHLGYDTFLEVSIQMGKKNNFVLEIFFTSGNLDI